MGLDEAFAGRHSAAHEHIEGFVGRGDGAAAVGSAFAVSANVGLPEEDHVAAEVRL